MVLKLRTQLVKGWMKTKIKKIIKNLIPPVRG